MAFVYSLNVAADFGDMIGQSGGDTYRNLADKIKVLNLFEKILVNVKSIQQRFLYGFQ